MTMTSTDTPTRPHTAPADVVDEQADEFRLDIVTGPDPDSPTAVVWFRADGIAAAIAQGRRFLAALDDQYGELSQRNGDMADFLTNLHLGA